MEATSPKAAQDALAKRAEIPESDHTEVTAKDLLGKVIDLTSLQAEADQAP
jgi:hypothetical protein